MNTLPLSIKYLENNTYEVASNFVTRSMVYAHEKSMLIVENSGLTIVVRAFILRVTKNKSTDAIDVQCWYDDTIEAVVTVRQKKEIPILLELINERGRLLPPVTD